MYFDSLISQLDKLMTCDYPTPESHGNLMSDQFQNLWVMSVLREELELIQNLLLYVDSCELQLKSFLKLFRIILVRCLLDFKCSNISQLWKYDLCMVCSHCKCDSNVVRMYQIIINSFINHSIREKCNFYDQWSTTVLQCLFAVVPYSASFHYI